MGKEVDIVECDITIKDEEEAQKIMDMFEAGEYFNIEDSKLMPKMDSYSPCIDEYLFFAALAKVAEGHIEYFDIYGNHWKIELKDGQVIDYKGVVVYKKRGTATLPDNVLRDKCDVIVNGRYIAVISKPTAMAYDLKEKRFYRRFFANNYRDMAIIENIVKEKDVAEFSDDRLDKHNLEWFAKKVLEKYPPLEPLVKKALLVEIA